MSYGLILNFLFMQKSSCERGKRHVLTLSTLVVSFTWLRANANFGIGYSIFRTSLSSSAVGIIGMNDREGSALKPHAVCIFLHTCTSDGHCKLSCFLETCRFS